MGRQTEAFECGPKWTNSRVEYRTRHHPLASLVFRYGCPHMKTRTHFTFRVDTWTADGESIVEHVAGVEDYQIALATFHGACQRWPGTPITLRRGARVIEDRRRLRVE